jgi:hypothetical protein
MNETKICKRCRAEKPLADFYKTLDGKPRARCKACHCADTSKRQQGRYRKNPEGQKARSKRWREKHPNQYREMMRQQMAKIRRKHRDIGQTFLPIDAPSIPRRPVRGVAAVVRSAQRRDIHAAGGPDASQAK